MQELMESNDRLQRFPDSPLLTLIRKKTTTTTTIQNDNKEN